MGMLLRSQGLGRTLHRANSVLKVSVNTPLVLSGSWFPLPAPFSNPHLAPPYKL